MFANYPEVFLLLLLLFGITSGLQQSRPPITSTDVFFRRPILSCQNHHQRSRCLWASSEASRDEASGELWTEQEDLPTKTAWDEQFKELQSFKSEYGHCNFPQNPPKELERKYPMLKRFCHDQRAEYKRLPKSKSGKKMVDRSVRCRRLEELGFDFISKRAIWYDHYHELIQYSSENGHMRPTKGDNPSLLKWMYKQRSRRNDESKSYAKLADSQIKLMDDIGFEWKSELYDDIWNSKYKELVAFRNKHGHLMVETHGPLDQWINDQRRRAGVGYFKTLTDEQRRLLDEIEFPWKPEKHDVKWYTMYEELQRFRKKNGHCQPGTSSKLYSWSKYQNMKHRQGRLSTEKTKLLEKIDFPFKHNKSKWPPKYGELVEYCNTHGHIHVNQDDDPDLYEWMDIQRQRYHGIVKPAMSDPQIEKLEEVHFCWSLDWRERTWHEKYAEAVEFFKEHGNVGVTQKENPSLYNWIQTQEKRYNEFKGQKPLSKEELEILEQIDFPFFDDQPRLAWNEMYTKVERYREEHDGRFPASHKDDPELSRWMRQQRHRYRSAYGYAALSDEQKTLLESIDFPMYPNAKHLRSWYEKYDTLVDFWKHRGHFVVYLSKDATLHRWIQLQRSRFHGSVTTSPPLSKLELYLLERIGFTWVSDRKEVLWQEMYDELVKFLDVRGTFPKRSGDDEKLAQWTYDQRVRYRGHERSRELSESQIEQLEKIGFSSL